jgi:hypothetical protein
MISSLLRVDTAGLTSQLGALEETDQERPPQLAALTRPGRSVLCPFGRRAVGDGSQVFQPDQEL